MTRRLVSRRHLLQSFALVGLAASVLEACGGATAPASGASTPAAKAATSAPAAGAAAAPTTAAAATAAPAAAGKVALRIAVFPDRPWMTRWATTWQKNNTDVALTIDNIAYADMNTKQLTELASGTMQDVVFSGNKWLRYTAYKNGFRPIDDYTKTKPYDKEDMIPSAIVGGTFEGKLYGLPSEWNPGNINVIMYNKDMVQAKGVKEPVDTWTHEQFTDFAVQMTDKAKGVFGTDIFPGTYYDFGDLVRDVGGDVMSDDGKKFLFGTDQKNLDIARWLTDMRVKQKIAPDRASSQQEQLFPTGKIASTATNAVSVKSTAAQIGTKFKWGAVLGPTGKEGLRGYDSFALLWNIYTKSQQPERAYDLMMTLTSKEAATDALQKEGQVPGRISVWRDPDANKESDIFKRVADWISDGKSKGPFPIPDNLRYTELETAYENIGFPIFYGEVGFDEGVKKTQEECQRIMDQPRG